jgi:sugar-specific transcriptional regulator TrmB
MHNNHILKGLEAGFKINSLEENLSILVELGLSYLQAKVFLTLAKSRTLKASEISSLTGIARPDVYRVLVQLDEAGLVEVMLSKPEEFQALSIEECVSNLIQRRILKTADLQKKALILTQDFKGKLENEEPEEKFQFKLISNKEAVFAKAEKMTKNAQKTICFLASRRRMIAWLLNYLPIMEEAIERKVCCQIIMPKADNDRSLRKITEALDKYPNFSLRTISEVPSVGLSVWDRKETMLNTLAIDTPLPHPALWSNNKSIVEVSQNYFDCTWQKAKKINLYKEKLTAL